MFLSLAFILAFVLWADNPVQAATKQMMTYSDKPVRAAGEGAFRTWVRVEPGVDFPVQGWVATDDTIANFYWQYYYNGKTYKGALTKSDRPDVKNALSSYGYKTHVGFSWNEKTKPALNKLPNGTSIELNVYATVNNKGKLIGTYNVVISYQSDNYLVSVVRQEYNNWQKLTVEQKKERKTAYFKYGANQGYYEGKAWCAAFVSYCAAKTGYSHLIGQNNALGNPHTYCPAMRYNFISQGRYLSNYNPADREILLYNVKPGDVIFLIGGQEKKKYDAATTEPYETHHVGIVTRIKKDSSGKLVVSYIDGNSGNQIDYKQNRPADEIQKTVNQKAILGFGLFHN